MCSASSDFIFADKKFNKMILLTVNERTLSPPATIFADDIGHLSGQESGGSTEHLEDGWTGEDSCSLSLFTTQQNHTWSPSQAKLVLIEGNACLMRFCLLPSFRRGETTPGSGLFLHSFWLPLAHPDSLCPPLAPSGSPWSHRVTLAKCVSP